MQRCSETRELGPGLRRGDDHACGVTEGVDSNLTAFRSSGGVLSMMHEDPDENSWNIKPRSLKARNNHHSGGTKSYFQAIGAD